MNTSTSKAFVLPDIGDKTIQVFTDLDEAVAALGAVCGAVGLDRTGLPVPRLDCDVIIEHLPGDAQRLQNQVLDQALRHVAHDSSTFRVTSRHSEHVDGNGPDGALMMQDSGLLTSRHDEVVAATTIGWRLDTFHTPKVGEPEFGRWLLIDRRGDDWLAWLLGSAQERSSDYASGILEQWAFELWRRRLVTRLTAISG